MPLVATDNLRELDEQAWEGFLLNHDRIWRARGSTAGIVAARLVLPRGRRRAGYCRDAVASVVAISGGAMRTDVSVVAWW
jgi:hypothetical protein